MKTCICNDKELNLAVYERIKSVVGKNPGALIAVSAGKTQEGLFHLLAEKVNSGDIDLSGVKMLCVTEFCKNECPEFEFSCREYTEEAFLNRIRCKPSKCIFLDEDNIHEIDSYITSEGGIDLAILGIGTNGHIAYNEPTTAFDSPSHIQKLTASTKKDLGKRLGSEKGLPETAYTIGIYSIVASKEIVVMAIGAEKAKPVFNMLYARNDSLIPAAFLQLPANVSVYLDREAASEL